MIHKQLNKKSTWPLKWLLVLFIFQLLNQQTVLGSVRTDLYGHELIIDYTSVLNTQAVFQNEEDVKSILARLEKSNLPSVVNQLDQYSVKFGMDDLAYILMTQKFCANVYATKAYANLLLFALLKEKGYDAIFGFDSGQTTVYATLGFRIMNSTYVRYKGKEYTDISFTKNLEPCKEKLIDLNNGGRLVMMNESRPPFFNAMAEDFQYYFEFEGTLYFFKGTLNKSLVAYYRDLPDIEFGQVYLNYKLSDDARNALVNQLKNAIGGMYESKQIDFLLSFTQQALPYKKDNEQLGKEKFSFPEEVLSNAYGDCEDKSVLFAYLAKEVLDLPSLALIYFGQNHLNVALEPKQSKSYNFTYKQTKYLVCEPSGMGFSPGDNVYDINKASLVSW